MEDLSFEPQKVDVRTTLVHETMTKEVPVKASFTGTLPDGMKMTSSTVTPYKVTVSGPPSVVKTMTEVKTDDIDLASHGNERSVRINLSLPDNVRADNRVVTVDFTISSEK
jgi:YbbR domain-containing protein